MIEKLPQIELEKERIEVEAKKCWAQFLSSLSNKYYSFNQVVNKIAQLDCLNSLALVSRSHDYSKPNIVSELQIVIQNGRNPILEDFVSELVPNSINLSLNQKCMILTGPNMGGKTVIAKQIALILIMAQIGCYIPAESSTLSPFDGIYTRMGARDQMFRNQSTFFVELHETSLLMKCCTEKSLVILDEFGRGTSTHDGVSLAYATLHYLVNNLNPFTIFITHYPSVGKIATIYPDRALNFHMGYHPDENSNSITFLYQLVEGIEKRSYGLNVAKLANLPEGVLNVAKIQSESFENHTNRNKAKNFFQQLFMKGTDQTQNLLDLQNKIKEHFFFSRY